MVPIAEQDVIAGQAVYSRSVLALYDFLALGVSNRFIWRCPTSRLLELYDSHISGSHLDVGVGTGFFLDHASFPAGPRVVLVDLNANSLAVASRRMERYRPKAYCRNVLEPLQLNEEGFDSIGMNYLLHCLPGDLQTKASVFDCAGAYLNPGGTVFGGTLLQHGVARSAAARRLMDLYNRNGIFCNTSDDLDGLRQELESRFPAVGIQTVGCAGLFWASK